MAAGFSSGLGITNTGSCLSVRRSKLHNANLMSKITILINMGRDGLPGEINAGSVGIRGMPAKKQRYSSLVCFAQSEAHTVHIRMVI